MQRVLIASLFLGLAACGQSVESLDPAGDEDGDGFINSDEMAQGTDPFSAEDIPYAGGWRKAACRSEIVSTGNDEGQIAEDFGLVDQYGETFHLQDVCDRVLLVEYSGFT